MNQVKKTKAVLDNLDQVLLAVEQVHAIEDPQQRKDLLRSILYYWLGVVYDEAFADRANIEIALDTSQKIVDMLKEQNKTLLKRISRDR